ncbi:hypothetical protein D3C80_947500 [compost metagenome]
MQPNGIPIRGFDAIDRFKFHAWRNLRCCCDGVGGNFTNNRTNTRDTDDKHQPISEDSKDEVGYRTGSDDSGALAHCFVVERVVSHFRRDRFYAFIKHFDVTAKRDQRDDKLSAMAIGTAPQRFTKANRETLDPHSTAPGNPEMAKFMHGNQYTQCNYERRQIPENAQHKTFR